jgi:hypothetical protein
LLKPIYEGPDERIEAVYGRGIPERWLPATDAYFSETGFSPDPGSEAALDPGLASDATFSEGLASDYCDLEPATAV